MAHNVRGQLNGNSHEAYSFSKFWKNCSQNKSTVILSLLVLATLTLLVTGILAGQGILKLNESGTTGLLTSAGILGVLLYLKNAWTSKSGLSFVISGFILSLLSIIVGTLAFCQVGGLAIIGTPGSIALIATSATYLGISCPMLGWVIYLRCGRIT
jgi:hypothetical protein